MLTRPTTARIGPWTVRFVFKGERYGLDNVLLHEQDEPLVEFYDAEQSLTKFGPLGQFVTRYYLTTLLENRQKHPAYAPLALDLGIPRWTVSAPHMGLVEHWLQVQSVYNEGV
jgi:hypothetical protein